MSDSAIRAEFVAELELVDIRVTLEIASLSGENHANVDSRRACVGATFTSRMSIHERKN